MRWYLESPSTVTAVIPAHFRGTLFCFFFKRGGLGEWIMPAVLKTATPPKGVEGPNPSPSAKISMVIPFPPRYTCPTCQRPCSPEDICECLTCGQQYCSHKECDWTCDCDRIAAELAQRMDMISSARKTAARWPSVRSAARSLLVWCTPLRKACTPVFRYLGTMYKAFPTA